MLEPSIKLSGRGTVLVKHADLSVSEYPNGNDLLDKFYDWVGVQQFVSSLTVTGKVGTGSGPTNLTMSELESPVTLLQGNWPIAQNVSGGYSTLKDANTISATIEFTLAFNVGQIAANISEYGIDLTYKTDPSDAGIHTRVRVTDSDDNSTTIPIKITDQLIIKYVIDLQASVDVPAYDLAVDRGNGITDVHSVKFYWGQHLRFAEYLSHKGWPGNNVPVNVCYTNAPAANLKSQSGTWFNGNNIVPVLAADRMVIPISLDSNMGNISEGINIITSGNGQGWWRFHIDPPLMKTDNHVLNLSIERPFRGELSAPPVIVGDTIELFGIGGYRWLDNGLVGAAGSTDTTTAVWDNGEVQVALGGYMSDGKAVTRAGKKITMAIDEDEYPTMVVAVGQYAGLTSGQSIIDYYDVVLKATVGSETQTFKLQRNPSGEHLFVSTNGAGAYLADMGNDGVITKAGEYITGSLHESTAMSFYFNSESSLKGYSTTFTDIFGQLVGGTIKMAVTVSPKDISKDSIAAELTIENIAGQANAVVIPPTANTITAYSIGANKWQEPTGYLDFVMPATHTAVWDNGEFQIAMGAYVDANSTPVYDGKNVSLAFNSGDVPFVAFSVGRYLGRPEGTSFEVGYDITLTMSAQSATKTYYYTSEGWKVQISDGVYGDWLGKDDGSVVFDSTSTEVADGAAVSQLLLLYMNGIVSSELGVGFAGDNNDIGSVKLVIRAVPKNAGKDILEAEMTFTTSEVAQVAEVTNYSTATIYKWEDGGHVVGYDTPNSDTAVWDNGEFQVAMGVYNSSEEATVYSGTTGRVDIEAGKYATLAVAVGQYTGLAANENFYDHYDCSLFVKVGSKSVTYLYNTSTKEWRVFTPPSTWSASLGIEDGSQYRSQLVAGSGVEGFSMLFYADNLTTAFAAEFAEDKYGVIEMVLVATPKDAAKATISAKMDFTIAKDTGEVVVEPAAPLTTYNLGGWTWPESDGDVGDDASPNEQTAVWDNGEFQVAIGGYSSNKDAPTYVDGTSLIQIPEGEYAIIVVGFGQYANLGAGTILSNYDVVLHLSANGSAKEYAFKLLAGAGKPGFLTKTGEGTYATSYMGDNRQIVSGSPQAAVAYLFWPEDGITKELGVTFEDVYSFAIGGTTTVRIVATPKVAGFAPIDAQMEITFEAKVAAVDTGYWPHTSDGSLGLDEPTPTDSMHAFKGEDLTLLTGVMGIDEDNNTINGIHSVADTYVFGLPSPTTYQARYLFGVGSRTVSVKTDHTIQLVIDATASGASRVYTMRLMWRDAQYAMYWHYESVEDSGNFDTPWYDVDVRGLNNDKAFVGYITGQHIHDLTGALEAYGPYAYLGQIAVAMTISKTVGESAILHTELLVQDGPYGPHAAWPHTADGKIGGETYVPFSNSKFVTDGTITAAIAAATLDNGSTIPAYYDDEEDSIVVARDASDRYDSKYILAIGNSSGVVKDVVEVFISMTVDVGGTPTTYAFKLLWRDAQYGMYLHYESVKGSGNYDMPWYDPTFYKIDEGKAYVGVFNANAINDLTGGLSTEDGVARYGDTDFIIRVSQLGGSEISVATKVTTINVTTSGGGGPEGPM